ncbi:MAG TPA: ACP S-malonyltransferase [Dictyoglomaceae bacterium]|nr:ACP S-malonyltransferase [Dictyoglomaceae bacterium]
MKLAFVFPGQGSQSVGMYSSFLAKREFESYFKSIEKVLGKDFIEKVQGGPEELVKDTKVSQPAVFSISAMLSDFLTSNGIIPEYVAGHSLGEYSAFYSAKVFNFEEGLRLIQKRAEIMGEVANKVNGGMWAVLGGNLEEIGKSLIEVQKMGENLWTSNFNSPDQVVLSGEISAFEKWYERMKEKVKRVVPLSISGPFHSPLMKEVEDPFKNFLENFPFKDPKIKVLSSTTLEFIEKDNQVKEILLMQLTNPVRWVETVNTLSKIGVDCFVEVGSGKVLQGLIKKITPEVKILSFEKPEDLSNIKGVLGLC